MLLVGAVPEEGKEEEELVLALELGLEKLPAEPQHGPDVSCWPGFAGVYTKRPECADY